MEMFQILLISALITISNTLEVEEKNDNSSLGKVFYYQPEQVHLSFGESVLNIVVTWSTRDYVGESVVQYGKSFSPPIELEQEFGESIKFVDGGKHKRSQWIHKVTLKNLRPDTRYEYICGSSKGWSSVFSFKTVKSDSADWSPQLAIYGDLGNENAQSIPRLQQDTEKGMYDAIFHVGDFAYDMDSDNAAVGNEFMKQLEPIAANVPYMVCPGNHEEKYNFSNYRSRFNMPGGTENLFYSFNLGPVHFISYSTEPYFFLDYGMKILTTQYAWLEKDLQEANKPKNREERPWIITLGHRSMYCSDDQEYDCNENLETYTRKGLPIFNWFGLEDLFYKYSVDVEIFGHQHFYTRLWPIYNFKVYNGSTEAPYTNAKAPIHIISGSAGCKEGRERFSDHLPDWNAFHSQDYGYARMKAYNRTHLYFEQISDDKDGQIVDSFWVVKNKSVGYKPVHLDS